MAMPAAKPLQKYITVNSRYFSGLFRELIST
jgi:hypothetical protein